MKNVIKLGCVTVVSALFVWAPAFAQSRAGNSGTNVNGEPVSTDNKGRMSVGNSSAYNGSSTDNTTSINNDTDVVSDSIHGRGNRSSHINRSNDSSSSNANGR